MSRQATWSRALIEQEKAILRQLVAETLDRVGSEGVSRLLSERIGMLEGDFTPEMQARRFVHVVGLIAWHEREDFLSPSQVNGLFDTAAAILRIHGIPEETSKMSFLHGELRLLRSQLRRKEGRSIEAAWDALLARSVTGRAQLEEGRSALAIALRSMRRGETRLAIAAFADAEAHATDRVTRERACLGRVQLLRLAGYLKEAEEFANLLLEDDALSAEARLELDWERMCRQARETGEVLPLVLASSRGGSHRHSSYVIESTIWVKVCSAKGTLTRVPKVESIRRTFPDHVRRGAPHGRFYDVALRLDRCYDLEIPLMLRLDELGGVLAEATRLPTLDKELLAWAAAARWLSRSKQAAHLEFVLAEYRALSLRVTMGGSEDALGMLADLLEPRVDNSPHRDVETSGVARAASLASLTLAVAGIKLSGRFKRALDPKVDITETHYFEHTAIARHLLTALGKMRGPVVKFIQFLAPMFATNESILKALSVAYDSLPAMPTLDPYIRFEKCVGKSIDEVFSAFEREPIAAASIGQVHRGVLRNGKLVAVKFLYPNISRAMSADFQLLKRLRLFLGWVFPEVNHDASVTELAATIEQECDLLRERQYYDEFRGVYANDPDIFIPQSFPEISTREILVTEFVKGRTLQEFVETSTADERRQIARKLFKLLGGFNKHGLLLGDTHRGNLFVLDDGRLAVIDFGYAEHYPADRAAHWRIVTSAAIRGNEAELREGLKRLGYLDGVPVSRDLGLAELLKSVRTVFSREKPAPMNKSQLEGLMRSLTVGSDLRKYVRFNVRDVRLLRNFVSLMGLLTDLDIEDVWGELALEYFAGNDQGVELSNIQEKSA